MEKYGWDIDRRCFSKQTDQNKERINTTIRDYAAIDWIGEEWEPTL